MRGTASLLLLGFGLLLSCARGRVAREGGKTEPPPNSDADDEEVVYTIYTISSCEDLSNKLTAVRGIVTVTGDIICPEPKTVRVADGATEVLFVSDHPGFGESTPMHTKGVTFDVPAGTRMAFGGSTLLFESTKGQHGGIFRVGGRLVLHAQDYSHQPPAGSTRKDTGQLIRGAQGGIVEGYDDSAIRFTDTSIVVFADRWAIGSFTMGFAEREESHAGTAASAEAKSKRRGNAAQQQQQQWQEAPESSASGDFMDEDTTHIISSCADLMAKRTPVQGVVTITGEIDCEEPKILRVADGAMEVMFISDLNDDGLSGPMLTKGIAFEIPTGTVMGFTGSVLTFETGKDQNGGIFRVGGRLVLHADDYTYQAPVDTSVEDLHGLIRGADDAIVEGYNASAVRFTKSSITVFADRKKGVAGTSTGRGRGSGSGSGSGGTGDPCRTGGPPGDIASSRSSDDEPWGCGAEYIIPWLPYAERIGREDAK